MIDRTPSTPTLATGLLRFNCALCLNQIAAALVLCSLLVIWEAAAEAQDVKDAKAAKEIKEPKEAKDVKDPHEAFAEESLKALDKAATLLASVKDKKTVDAKAKLPEIGKSLADLKGRIAIIGEPAKEQRAALERQFKLRFEAAIRKFRDEAIRVASAVEGGKELLDEFDKQLKPLTAKKN